MKKIIVVFALIIVCIIFKVEHCKAQFWSPLGSGMDSTVRALTVFNNELIAGGSFTTAGGVSANRIAKWNGTSWSPLGSGMNSNVLALTVFNNELIAGGTFTTAGGVSANYIAKWNGTTWSPLGSGMNSNVFAFTIFNNALIAGGTFTTAGGDSAKIIAKWNGTNWLPMGTIVAGGTFIMLYVEALTVYNNELIAGANYSIAYPNSALTISKWNGTTWLSFGSSTNSYIYTLSVYNNELIAGGSFFGIGVFPALFLAKWNGTTWSPLGSGIDGTVYALTVFNNELITGGGFFTAGGVNVNCIAKWNGTAWSPLGSGMNTTVQALTVFNNILIAGGSFTTAGGVSANRIAKWGASFSVSGLVRYSDNNQPVTSGYVKVIKLDKNTSNIIILDSAAIQSDGSYTLTKVPQDSVDIGVYPNSTPPNDWVITYYPSTIYWQDATVLYPTGNMTNVNIGVKRLISATASNSVNGKVMRLTDSQLGNLKDAVLYAKNGNTFVRCAVSDGNGVYHLNSLPTGNLKIIVNRLGFTGDSTIVNVTATSNIDSINFYLYRVPVGIKQISNNVPSEYKLYQNYPNPFNPSTIIKYQVASKEDGFRTGAFRNDKVVLKVYDILGKEVATLVNEKQSPGVYEVTWDARHGGSSTLPSGIYFYKLETQSYKETKKMVLLK
ncbi:MAG: T9SS type A sorting domain-containing protein [Ignavibacteriae bacterium]|nr:T9SS type A sorting domain-containing protein [Ignavibacteriota bacterium]